MKRKVRLRNTQVIEVEPNDSNDWPWRSCTDVHIPFSRDKGVVTFNGEGHWYGLGWTSIDIVAWDVDDEGRDASEQAFDDAYGRTVVEMDGAILRRAQAHCETQAAKDFLAAPNDIVNHPSHYTSHPSGVECITLTEHMPFNIGNVFKYLWRAGLKDSAPTAEDYNKACWYLIREMKRQGVKLTVGAAEIEGAR